MELKYIFNDESKSYIYSYEMSDKDYEDGLYKAMQRYGETPEQIWKRFKELGTTADWDAEVEKYKGEVQDALKERAYEIWLGKVYPYINKKEFVFKYSFLKPNCDILYPESVDYDYRLPREIVEEALVEILDTEQKAYSGNLEDYMYEYEWEIQDFFREDARREMVENYEEPEKEKDYLPEADDDYFYKVVKGVKK